MIVENCHAAARELSHISQTATPAFRHAIAVVGAGDTEPAAQWIAATIACDGRRIGLLTESIEDDGEYCFGRGDSADASTDWATRCELGGVDTVVAQLDPQSPAGAPIAPTVWCVPSLRCDGLDHAGRRRWPSAATHTQSIAGLLQDSPDTATLVINAADQDAVRVAASLGRRTLTFGEAETADVRVTPLECHHRGQNFLVHHGAESAGVSIDAPGVAARRDAAAAIAVAIACGVPIGSAIDGLRLAPATPQRMTPLAHGQRFPLWLDAAARPIDLADAIRSVEAPNGRTLVALRLADDPSVARRQLATAARMADRVFAIGANAPGHADDGTSTDQQQAEFDNVTRIDDLVAALAVAIGLAEDGDAVLIAGVRRRDGVTLEERIAADLVEQRLRQETAPPTRRRAA
ncbi:MAG: hypothetical protein AAF805_10820 [Planctomycetota bacterium]